MSNIPGPMCFTYSFRTRELITGFRGFSASTFLRLAFLGISFPVIAR